MKEHSEEYIAAQVVDEFHCGITNVVHARFYPLNDTDQRTNDFEGIRDENDDQDSDNDEAYGRDEEEYF